MGIDASPAMVAKMRAKPGGADIPVVMGNFADVKVSGGGFGLVYIVFSTLFALRNQDEQLRCFQHAAKAHSSGRRVGSRSIQSRPFDSCAAPAGHGGLGRR